jgi:chromosome segregation ATPase
MELLPTNSLDRSVDLGSLIGSMELELAERQRQIALLNLKVERHRRESELAQAHAAMVQSALDRHLALCEKDESAVQRLMAEIAESTARRKEQVAVIERRDRRIVELQQQLALLQGGQAEAAQMSFHSFNGKGMLNRLKQMFRG